MLTEDQLNELTPQEIIDWVAQTFQNRAGLSCSFGGPGGIVLAHMASKTTPKIPLLFIDTDFLFEETYTLKRKLEQEWGLEVRVGRARLSPKEQAKEHGSDLWLHNPDLCCHMRKVEPMSDLLEEIDCWVTALRRDQSRSRETTKIMEEHSLAGGKIILKVNPLATWSRQMVWDYIHKNNLPYNPLLDQGYGSIGCIHCTAPSTGSDERSGRWKASGKTECGLHTFTDRKH